MNIKDSFYQLPDSQICLKKFPRKFLQFFKAFQSSKSCLIRFGISFPEICFQKVSSIQFRVILSNLHQKQKTWLFTQKSTLSHWLYTKISFDSMRNLAEMLLVLVFFFFYYRQYLLFLQQTNFNHSILLLLLCVFLLKWNIQVHKRFIWLDTVARTKMIFFVIGNDQV